MHLAPIPCAKNANEKKKQFETHALAHTRGHASFTKHFSILTSMFVRVFHEKFRNILIENENCKFLCKQIEKEEEEKIE